MTGQTGLWNHLQLCIVNFIFSANFDILNAVTKNAPLPHHFWKKIYSLHMYSSRSKFLTFLTWYTGLYRHLVFWLINYFFLKIGRILHFDGGSRYMICQTGTWRHTDQRYRIFLFPWKSSFLTTFRLKSSEWVKMVFFFSSAVFFFRPLKMSEWVKCKLFQEKKNKPFSWFLLKK